MNDLCLEVSDLDAGYLRTQVLSQVSLQLWAGQIFTIIGPNGSGKSTLVRCIAGLLRPWSGAIILDGQNVTGVAPHQLLNYGMATVLQGRTAFTKLTVRENLELGGFTLDHHSRKKMVESMLLKFPHLAGKQHLVAGSLSSGEQQLVEIARALMRQPRLLVLDEPTLGLSPKNVSLLMSTLLDLNRQGQTILMVEQNAQKALEISDQACVLELGRVRTAGDARKIMEDEAIRRAYVSLT